ncbi:hypothetical protein OWV82_005747 [Melia azedarach]|uniref:Uncharacterized protein n=1 Tax=Melia azedarach TaxID=155640 RepID=A0ACC1YFK9_MELAZ|nr:hypothetical protein OWV82_005747 [Melia azedarach]
MGLMDFDFVPFNSAIFGSALPENRSNYFMGLSIYGDEDGITLSSTAIIKNKMEGIYEELSYVLIINNPDEQASSFEIRVWTLNAG